MQLTTCERRSEYERCQNACEYFHFVDIRTSEAMAVQKRCLSLPMTAIVIPINAAPPRKQTQILLNPAWTDTPFAIEHLSFCLRSLPLILFPEQSFRSSQQRRVVHGDNLFVEIRFFFFHRERVSRFIVVGTTPTLGYVLFQSKHCDSFGTLHLNWYIVTNLIKRQLGSSVKLKNHLKVLVHAFIR